MRQKKSLRSLLLAAVILAGSASPVFAGSVESMRILRGEVLVDTTPAGSILVALDEATLDQGADGTTDHVFRLQRSGVDVATLSRRAAVAVVAVTDQFLKLSAADWEKPIVLELVESDDPASPRFQGGDHLVLTGYGLSHQWEIFDESLAATVEGLRTAELDSASGEELFAVPTFGLEKGGCPGPPPCDTGDCGASSCTISGCASAPTSCSTSCVPSRYACCRCTSPTGHAQCGCFLTARFCC